jgi:hypothetical protein
MLKLMWMMWSSRPDPMMSSSLISRRLSIACDGFDGSSTRQSASLVCLRANYSGSFVSHRGIEANPEKVNAIIATDAPKMINDIQKLTGCMAALNRFISRLGERGLL